MTTKLINLFITACGFALLCSVLSACNSKTSTPTAGTSQTVGPNSSASGQAESPIEFHDVTKAIGVQHVYHNGEESNLFTYLEAMGGGVGTLDYDNDGWEDLFFPSGGRLPELGKIEPLPGLLMRNREGQNFIDVTYPAHADQADYYSQGIAAGDLNSDGFADFLVTGFGGLNLFLNQGDGTFIESAQRLGMDDPQFSTSAGMGDINNDSLLDIYVAHYVDWSWEKNPECKSTAGVRDVCPPAAFGGVQDAVFMNQANGKFVRVTSEIGLVAEGKGLGVVCADFDQDGKIDVYVANDTNNNYMYINQGNGRLLERGVDSGTALDDKGVSNGSMGVAVLDYDGNSTPDLWVCNYEDETFALYKNDGGANFRFVSSAAGITALGSLFVAFGTVSGDFDRDGDEDLAVVNGHVLRYPSDNTVPQFPLILTNNAKGRFVRQQFTSDNYFAKRWRGRGLIAFDYDHDGDIDMAAANVNEPAAVLRNDTASSGAWCELELIGWQSNRNAIGAQLTFHSRIDGKQKQTLRWVVGGGSFLSQSSYVVHWSCPKDELLDHIEVKWPSGIVQQIQKPEMNVLHQILEIPM